MFFKKINGDHNAAISNLLNCPWPCTDFELLLMRKYMNFVMLNGVGFRRNWREVKRGGVSTFHENNVKLMPCKLCKVIHLAEAHYVSYVCPSHEQSV